MSDGTSQIRVIDPSGFRETRRIQVAEAGQHVWALNELEWVRGELWANVYQTPFILSLALTEAIAIFGLVIAQGRLAPSALALPFFAVAWALFGLRFPRVASVVQPAERLYGARLAS